MSLKLFLKNRYNDDNLIDSELLDRSSAAGGFTRIPKRDWIHTWSFNLHHKIPISKAESKGEDGDFFQDRYQYQNKEQPKLKEMIRKYYGKKILYVTKSQEAHAIVSRSKLLKSVKVQKDLIKKSLKSKGNLIIVPHNIKLLHLEKNGDQKEEEEENLDNIDDNEEENYGWIGYDKSDHWWNIEKDRILEIHDGILFKKILQNCQTAEIKISEDQDLRLPGYWCALRQVSLKIRRDFDFVSLREIVRNLLNLEVMKLETTQHSKKKKTAKQGCFEPLNKLLRLQKVKLVTNPFVLQAVDVERDLEKFYSHPRNFVFLIKIHFGKKLEQKENPSLVRILNAAEYLKIGCHSYYKISASVAKEHRKKLELGLKNIVKISCIGEDFDAAKILSSCDSMEYLYIKDRSNVIAWNQKSMNSGFQNLKAAVLEFGEIHISSRATYQRDSFYSDKPREDLDIVGDEKEPLSRFATSLFPILSQLKERACSLQHLDVSFFLFDLASYWVKEQYPKNTLCFEENLKKFVEELSTFDKIKTFGLLAYSESSEILPLGKILSNKGLESFRLEFTKSDLESPEREWEGCFATENTSEIKKLLITIPPNLKIPLFRINLLNYVRKLESLQVVELVDSNLELIAFDFFYGFVSSLLDKKNLRKLILCTKVKNSFCPVNFGMLLSKSLKTQFQDVLNEVARDWESRIKKLNNLDEIIVGRLYNYSFDYLVYQKEMQVTDKLFWKEEQMEELLSEREAFARRYKEILDLFKIKKKRI